MSSITFSIPDNKLPEFKEAFFRSTPIPTDRHGTPLFSENAWIKEWGKRHYVEAFVHGKELLQEDGLITPDPLIIN